MIYLDNAATSQKKPQAVYDAVLYAMGHMGNAGRATHAASHGSYKTVFDTRALLTKFFHGDKISNCIFTKNSTESLNIAIQGSLKAGDHVITTVMEHNSVLRPFCSIRKRKAWTMTVWIPSYRKIPKQLSVPMLPTLPGIWWTWRGWESLQRNTDSSSLWMHRRRQGFMQ